MDRRVKPGGDDFESCAWVKPGAFILERVATPWMMAAFCAYSTPSTMTISPSLLAWRIFAAA